MIIFAIVNQAGDILQSSPKAPKFFETADEADKKLVASKLQGKVQAFSLSKVVVV